MSDERGESLPYEMYAVLLFIPGVLAAGGAVLKTITCLRWQDFSAGTIQPIVFLYVLAAVLILGGMASHRKAASF